MYQYTAIVVSVYDGDTAHLDVDLGFSMWVRGSRYRLARINAPELGTPEGVTARDYLATLLPVGSPITVQTMKDRTDNYGRMLVEIYLSDGRSVNQLMLDTGHAVPYP